MFHFDQHLTGRIRQAGQSHLPFWCWLSSNGMWIFIVVSLTLVWFGVMPFAYVLIPVLFTHGLALIVQQIIRRDRPPIDQSKIKMWWRTPSFPSAHSAGSMAFAVAIATVLLPYGLNGIIFGVVMIILALFIGFSRIVVGVHYLTDVLAGFLFGLLIVGIFISIY